MPYLFKSKIADTAGKMGLDFYDVLFFICSGEEISAISAYGMPSRFSHWSFGKLFERYRLFHALNVCRIHEVVINSNPCCAFLLKNNSPLENKLAAAHVFAHSDFFKNNIFFSHTPKDMPYIMGEHARFIENCRLIYGECEVERILDASLSIKELINPEGDCCEESGLWDRDILLHIIRNSHTLRDWQREILRIIRREMKYFWPQLRTRFLNEGWAYFWHTKIMRQMGLGDGELVEFSEINALALKPLGHGLNPYHLGTGILQHLEQIKGLKSLFSVRKIDISFVNIYPKLKGN